MAFLKRKEEIREDPVSDIVSDPLLRALLSKDEINRDTVLNIPAIAAGVNMIADTVASLPIKLYRRNDERIEEITNDHRTFLLNEDTGDTLDGIQFKKAMIIDMFLSKGAYAFVNKIGNEVVSIHYVKSEDVSFLNNIDPIFKDYQISVAGRRYEGYQFVKLFRNTRNGYSGRSVIEESPELLNIVYSSQKFEKNLVKTGGNKKGFLQSANKLSEKAITFLKNAFRKLYANNTENVVILNEGLSFKESSNTSVEMQLNENKKTNNDDVCKILLIPPPIVNGNPSQEDKKQYYEACIFPILVRFATAISRVLLTEEEKDTLFFAFDDSDLTKSDIEKRFNAYQIALNSGFMQIDEVRKNEKLPSFDLDFIKLGLQDVLYYPKTGEIYTPNTNKSTFDTQESRSKRKATIVIGAPCSGKSTFVNQNKKESDIEIDFDAIRKEITGSDRKSIENDTDFQKALKRRDRMIDEAVKSDKDVWIITTSTDFDQIYSWEHRLAADVHIMDVTKEECLKRLEEDPGGKEVESIKKVIENFYKNLDEFKERRR